MISEKRPICVMRPYGPKPGYFDFLYDWGKYTLVTEAEEGYLNPLDGIWDACCAEMRKEVPPEDRGKFGYEYAYAKCMEPAVYYVSVNNGGITSCRNVYCEYHKPRILENI